ncbi:hypothetical protein LINPERPRIM_LOCUS14609 [Linum perenne]
MVLWRSEGQIPDFEIYA